MADPVDPPKEDPPKEDPPKEDPPKEDPPKEQEPPKNDDLKSTIKEVLTEMGLGNGRQPVPPTRRVDIEAMAEEMVSKASAKLEKEKEQETRLGELEKVVKERAEETPRKVRKLTKALWGDEK